MTFFFPIIILEKEPVFPFLMFSAKQGNYWYHLYNVFGMTRSLTGWGLNPVPPALEASTVPLGYRGGGSIHTVMMRIDSRKQPQFKVAELKQKYH